jgi:uncharacterized protein YuzE
MTSQNPVHVELPGTEATVLYDEDAGALYIKLREDISGELVTQTVIESPLVNVDLREGEAVGIEILLAKSDEAIA